MFDVLIVDDDADTARMLLRLVKHQGYAGECAFDGHAALERLATDPLPKLVILDQMMPGIEGIEVLRRLRAQPRTAEIRVVIFSANANPAFEEQVAAEGADAFWPKANIDYSKIGSLIKDALAA
jgi:CheY-like chemotaxis protein